MEEIKCITILRSGYLLKKVRSSPEKKGDQPTFFFSMAKMNILGEIPSAVRWYGNHFLYSLLCIPNHNFYENIGKGCYAPQMRQGLDEYSHRNGHVIKHQKAISEYWNSDFQISGLEISIRKNIHMNNPGWNPSPVRCMEIATPFYWKSQFRQKGNRFVFKAFSVTFL